MTTLFYRILMTLVMASRLHCHHPREPFHPSLPPRVFGRVGAASRLNILLQRRRRDQLGMTPSSPSTSSSPPRRQTQSRMMRTSLRYLQRFSNHAPSPVKGPPSLPHPLLPPFNHSSPPPTPHYALTNS